ncbi:MAG TPA: radical SAM family heme chaperone HemW [Gemmatimonadaceae bacterium]|nr:radical SAM family heme chaperone HemW [Gemmatimonadaceae bacterium]
MLPRHLYVHVPFCARRCSYCDFSIAVRRTVPVAAYVDALARELKVRFGADGAREVDTLYLGGGTPSRLGGWGVAELMRVLRQHVTLAPSAEITLEANPDDITPDDAASWRAAGITRLSIGAQSFDDAALAWMHRTHDAARIAVAVHGARQAGFTDLSLDLIFALPEALRRDWRRDLTLALALEPTHLSLYGLTIEHGTPLARWRDRGLAIEAPDERYEREFLLAHELAVASGFEHYEVSNFGRPGFRARHNSAYWQQVPYAGVGPAAHGYDGTCRRWNVAAYEEWRRAVALSRDPLAGTEVLTAEQHAAERVYLGLRTIDGLEMGGGATEQVQRWLAAGWGTLANGRLRLSPLGWLRLDALAGSLTMAGSPY